MAKHAHARTSHARPSVVPAVLAVLVLVVCVGLAVAVLTVDTTWLMQLAVVAALAIGGIAVLVMLVQSRSLTNLRRSWASDREARQREMADLRLEIARQRQLNEAVLAQLGHLDQLRSALADYLVPVASEPDPVYPSLHLPLVRAAFAPPAEVAQILAYTPPVPPSEVPPAVSADSGSEGLPSRHLLDLTAGQQQHAAGA
jgi:hypothetical protein